MQRIQLTPFDLLVASFTNSRQDLVQARFAINPGEIHVGNGKKRARCVCYDNLMGGKCPTICETNAIHLRIMWGTHLLLPVVRPKKYSKSVSV